MLRKITRSGQVSIPKRILNHFQLQEGDYVDIEHNESSIVIKPVTIEELSPRDYEKLAAKLAKVEKEKGLHFPDSRSAREHLHNMMK
ncbi:MAG: AbrB/MazE/SpoVT family DNA-binding domain-containing protein [Deltaproteobacteria bacterium]|nr:AbrB/MazE/SpoVT family DNA-binding domain-containing protein [Deltaproteobacteria bacterium]